MGSMIIGLASGSIEKLVVASTLTGGAVALDMDVVGFLRKRTDDGKTPEFVDPATGRTTNTSAGAVFRGGLTFYW